MVRRRWPVLFKKRTGLLVEDDPDMAAEVTKELTNLGYHVRVAETEAEGLAAARSHPATLMIVDRMLKGIDSLSMIETLRREGIRIPVLVVSALASVDERIRGLKAGGDDYLIKPFAMGELAAVSKPSCADRTTHAPLSCRRGH